MSLICAHCSTVTVSQQRVQCILAPGVPLQGVWLSGTGAAAPKENTSMKLSYNGHYFPFSDLMHSCILCPLAPRQLAGWICKLVAAEDDWSVNRWNLMLIKWMHLMLHGTGLLEFLRLLRISYLEFCGSGCVCSKKQYKWRGPVVSESWLFCCLWVSFQHFLYQILFQGSCESGKCNDIWK